MSKGQEDFEHENGQYMCNCLGCGALFIGYKRRRQCKVCATEQAPAEQEPVDVPEGWLVELGFDVVDMPFRFIESKSHTPTIKVVLPACEADDSSAWGLRDEIAHRIGHMLSAPSQPFTAPAEQEVPSSEIAGLIVLDACETDPADPDASQTICISANDLLEIAKRHVTDGMALNTAPAQPVTDNSKTLINALEHIEELKNLLRLCWPLLNGAKAEFHNRIDAALSQQAKP